MAEQGPICVFTEGMRYMTFIVFTVYINWLKNVLMNFTTIKQISQSSNCMLHTVQCALH